MATVADSARAAGFAFFSVALHVAAATVCLAMAGTHAAAEPPPDWVDVTLEPPALGLPHGSPEGQGLGSHVEAPKPAAAPKPAEPEPPPPAPTPTPAAEPDPAATTPAPEPAAQPDTPAENPEPAPSEQPSSTGDGTGEPGAEPGGDPATPAGSANVPPGLGSPDGTPDGQGVSPPKPKMTPQYKGILSGWFASFFRGPDVDPEERDKLRLPVSVTISPSGHITGYALAGSSGNGSFDDSVRRTMETIQSSGAALPAPPEGGPYPTSFTTVFRMPRR